MLVFAAQLGAKTTDMHVDGAGAAVIVIAPHFLQQLRAGEHASRMLHEVLEKLELLVCQVDRMPMQTCRIAVGVHHQVAGVDHAVFVLHARFSGTGNRIDRRVAALGYQAKTPLNFGRGSGRHHHVGDAPLRIDHGEATLGEDEHDRRGQSGCMNQAAQCFRRGQIISRIQKKNGVFRHFHQTCRVHW